MPNNKVQVGQVWRRNDGDATFLITRLYTEALATIAVLRPTGSENSELLRVRVESAGEAQTLPGFSLAHQMD